MTFDFVDHHDITQTKHFWEILQQWKPNRSFKIISFRFLSHFIFLWSKHKTLSNFIDCYVCVCMYFCMCVSLPVQFFDKKTWNNIKFKLAVKENYFWNIWKIFTCPARQAGSWLLQSDPQPKLESHLAIFGWFSHHNGHSFSSLL